MDDTRHIDVHCKAIMDGMPAMPPDAQIAAQKWCEERLTKLTIGVNLANGYEGARAVQEGLSKHFSEKFQFRHDFDDNCLVLDKWDSLNSVWIPLMWWRDDNKKALRISSLDLKGLIERFEEADMQRYATPEAYLAMKRERAANVRKANELAADLKVEAAIDNMSNSQLKKFIEVHTAIAQGETVTAHGEDLKFLEQAHEMTKKAEAEGGHIQDHPLGVINPQHDPLRNAKRG